MEDLTKRQKARKLTLKWAKTNPERKKIHQRRHNDNLRNAIFDHYGRKCVCCGESHEFLTIDHINNDGGEHRKRLGTRNKTVYYRQIIDAGFPDDLQPLCWNCNYAKYLYGECPHKKKGLTRGKNRDLSK